MKAGHPTSSRPGSSSPFFSRPQVISLSVICVLAMADSGYLFALKLTGRISSLLGCGGQDGCERILGGRWSTWMLVPLSLLCFVIYLGLLLTVLTGTSSRWKKSCYLFAASLLTCAAVWFVALQALVERQFCLHCCILHGLGLTASVIIIRSALQLGIDQLRDVSGPALTASVVAFGVLISGQLWGPQPATHEVSDSTTIELPAATSSIPTPDLAADEQDREVTPVTKPSEAEAVERNDESHRTGDVPAAKPRSVSFVQGQIHFTIGDVPMLGNPAAPHVLVKYFDYTCHSCKEMHHFLEELQRRYPDKIAVIVIPCPLNRQCNPFMRPGARDHTHACEFARLGLAVWRADAKSFKAFHDAMFQRQDQITPAGARTLAKTLVDASKLEDAEFDIWIPDTLDQSLRVYRALSQRNSRMPKLLVGEQVVHGIPRDENTFIEAVRQQLNLP